MDVDLAPEQPPEVAATIAAMLAEPTSEPDPWWQAGLEAALEP